MLVLYTIQLFNNVIVDDAVTGHDGKLQQIPSIRYNLELRLEMVIQLIWIWRWLRQAWHNNKCNNAGNINT